MKIYNTLTRKVEEFKPINPPSPRSAGQVGMYTCGPTVYDHMHIGNLRTFVLSDILQRVLEFNDYRVKSVENITDIDDKIIKRAKEKNSNIEEVAQEFIKYFLQDINKLNISMDSVISPRATEYIPQMINYIENLVKKGFAYLEKDGSVYFDISKFPNYGKLSGIKTDQLKTGTRILSDEYEKDNVQDFALWKADSEVGFDSPWGKGRPGWHIECSVMSRENLGDTLDIHVGGVDLIFPHHENEIAQSEAATGKEFVKYWVHGAHMLVDGKKMSKSLNNFYTLKDVEGRGFSPLALRYLYLQTHYRQEMNFTWESLEAAQNAFTRLQDEVMSWDEPKIGCAEFEEKFKTAIDDDLNMPQALSVLWETVKSSYPSSAKAETVFKFDKVLGLGLDKIQSSELRSRSLDIPEEVQKLAKEREELRKQKRFHLADQLRNRIKKMGYEVRDDDETGETKVSPVRD